MLKRTIGFFIGVAVLFGIIAMANKIKRDIAEEAAHPKHKEREMLVRAHPGDVVLLNSMGKMGSKYYLVFRNAEREASLALRESPTSDPVFMHVNNIADVMVFYHDCTTRQRHEYCDRDYAIWVRQGFPIVDDKVAIK